MSTEKDHDNIAQEMFGVFEQEAKDVVIDKGNEGGSVMFNPNAKDAEEQTWRGVVKFLPNLFSEGMSNHIIKKISYWIKQGESGLRWDSPRSIGEKCFVNDKYWEFKNSKNAKVQEKADLLVYQPRTFALVQIIKDLQDETQNGKIKIWSLPQAIEKKINEQMYPSKKDVDMGAVANNIFNPLTGFPMVLKIGVKNVERNGKTSQFRDYDSCSFKDSPMGIIIDGESKPVDISKAKTDKELQRQILETIKNGVNLQEYAYKEPTQKDIDTVKAALEAIETGKVVKQTQSDDAENDAQTDAQNDAQTDAPKQEKKAEKSEEKGTDSEKKTAKKSEAKAEKKEEKKSEPKREMTDEEKMMADLGMGDDL